MREGLRFPLLIASVFGYAAGAGLLFQQIKRELSPAYMDAAVLAFAAVFLCGYVWLFAAIMMGSSRQGLMLLRWWLAIMIGGAVAVAPFAFLPHPAVLIGGGAVGFAVGSWIATGKAEWLSRN
jgi:hypothetical protein